MKFQTYDCILQIHDSDGDTAALEYAAGIVWSEVETSVDDIKYHRYVGTVDGVDVHYDFGADYYFFCPADDIENSLAIQQ